MMRLNHVLEASDRDYGSTDIARLSEDYPVKISDLVGEVTARLLVRDWLGHNGVSVSTRLDSSGSVFRQELSLTSDGDIFGLVCVFDDLRPDVSVSRDTLRGLSFDIRSAVQMAVRRAAGVYLDSPEHDFAVSIRKRELLTSMPLRMPTAHQVEVDPLASEWCEEQIIHARKDKALSATEIRSLARNGPVSLQMASMLWSKDFDTKEPWRRITFYGLLQAAIAERELDIELTDISRTFGRNYNLTVRSPERAARPSGLTVLPPFSTIRYQSSEIVIAPGYPANLHHPIVAWFAEHAVGLNAAYPAIFTQFRRALATIANLDYGGREEKRRLADGAADLLNATLDRIRRSVPEAPGVLSWETYADDSYRLRAR